MTNEEKALEIGTNNGLKYWFGKDEQDEKIISSVQSAIKIAEWKDDQFKEYLEKKRGELLSKYEELGDECHLDDAHVFEEIINELFPVEEIEDNTERED